LVKMDEVWADLGRQGWSRQKGSVENINWAVSRDGVLRSARPGQPNAHVLQAYTSDSAPRFSLSSVYGLGMQPLHSDGAHLPSPPDIVVLHSEDATPTSTVVWVPSRRGENQLQSSAAEGVFTVRGNEGSFLTSASTRERLRFDPVIMSPGDAAARATATYFDDARVRAYEHLWDEPDVALFIDNRRALHARNSVADPDTRRITRLAFQRETAS
jgi:alpha-ketoglutarate-dependent taurine dioxygenase